MKKDLVKSIAENARLALTDKEIEEFLPQLQTIIDAFSKIQKINAKDVKPSFHPIQGKHKIREDIIGSSLKQEESLSNTQHKKDGYFKGPKVV